MAPETINDALDRVLGAILEVRVSDLDQLDPVLIAKVREAVDRLEQLVGESS